jgi:hypothetical protein
LIFICHPERSRGILKIPPLGKASVGMTGVFMAIELNNLHKTYGDFKALQDVSLAS